MYLPESLYSFVYGRQLYNFNIPVGTCSLETSHISSIVPTNVHLSRGLIRIPKNNRACKGFLMEAVTLHLM